MDKADSRTEYDFVDNAEIFKFYHSVILVLTV